MELTTLSCLKCASCKLIFAQKSRRKAKNCSRLLEPQKVSPKAKSCPKVAEGNQDRPKPRDKPNSG